MRPRWGLMAQRNEVMSLPTQSGRRAHHFTAAPVLSRRCFTALFCGCVLCSDDSIKRRCRFFSHGTQAGRTWPCFGAHVCPARGPPRLVIVPGGVGGASQSPESAQFEARVMTGADVEMFPLG